MNNWFLARNGEREGPLTAKQIAALHAMGQFDVDVALAWKEGMADWLPVSQSGVLAEASEVRVATIGKPLQFLAPTASPYTPPGTVQAGLYSRREPVELSLEYPGLGRLAYFLWSFGLNLAAYLVMMVLFFLISLSGGGDSGGSWIAFVLLFMLMLAAGIYLAVLRVRNLGMSGLAVLWCLVPIASIWITWRMIACPPGYEDHRTLDTAGKVISALLAALIVLPILLMIFATVISGT